MPDRRMGGLPPRSTLEFSGRTLETVECYIVGFNLLDVAPVDARWRF